MCLMVYLASEKPLATIAWREDQPAFNVRTLEEWGWGQEVCSHFTKPHVYYIGSYQGCGCGFNGRDAHAMLCRRDLRDYVMAATAEAGTVEMYSCWAGDEGAELTEWSVILAEAIAEPEFSFEERQLLHVFPRVA